MACEVGDDVGVDDCVDASSIVGEEQGVCVCGCDGACTVECLWWKDYLVDFTSELGSGAFGVVCRGLHVATGRPCALKRSSLAEVEGADPQRGMLLQSSLEHPNVCQVFGSFVGLSLIHI